MLCIIKSKLLHTQKSQWFTSCCCGIHGNFSQARTTSQKEFTTYLGHCWWFRALIYSLLSYCFGVSFCSSSILFTSSSKKYLRFTRTVPVARSESGTRYTGTWEYTCTFSLGLMILLNLHHSSRLGVVLCQVLFQIISWCDFKVIIGQDTRTSVHCMCGIFT